ncbi:hypothetical protein ACP70R_033015 [Stipagrostis hirtigluma subsp. patula]
MDMEQQVEHCHLPIRGLNLHVAQEGKGERGTVVFLHGFPEIWYSWRHQMLAVAAAGYRAVAPDWRGYGLSDQPPEQEAASYDDLVQDLLAILDALSISKEPGRPEADFGRYDVKRVVRTIYILFSRSEIPIAKEDQEIMDLADLSTPLPEWFTEEDLAVYASLYEKSGFRYPMEMPYRSLHKRQPTEDPKFQVPVFVVMGEKDYVFKFPGVESVLRDGIMEKFAPDLKITYLPEGSHFVQEQFPEKVNELLISFLKDHPVSA